MCLARKVKMPLTITATAIRTYRPLASDEHHGRQNLVICLFQAHRPDKNQRHAVHINTVMFRAIKQPLNIRQRI
ncbi:hypothetical protein CWM85_03840 [Klebsiella michiganensis]|uniref:Uncharacterized protein n=1 Tax=Klebsiella michiganensis TaxID=1134687 RepID=A0A2J4ZYY1_9ENTR|nr:hypothetical protein CWM85_03840 [Klebsiella michiganensis]